MLDTGKRLISSWWHGRRLITKHAVIFLLVAFTVIPATFGTITWSARSVFLEIESKTIAAQTERARTSMRLFEESLSKSLGDYAYWDDSYDYTINPNAKFEASTLDPFTFENMGVDLVTYVRFDSRVIFANVKDSKETKFLPSESALIGQLTSTGAFFEAAKAKRNHLAYVRTGRGVYVLYSQWVSDTLGKKQPLAFMVMGQLLNTKALSDALQADVKLDLAPAPALAKTLHPQHHPLASKRMSKSVTSAMGVFAQDGKLIATIDFETPRSLIMAGQKALFSLFIGMVAGLAFMLWMLAKGIRQISVRRIQLLETYMSGFKLDGPSIPGALTKGSDEIASLGRQFQALTEKLREAEEQLQQKAYVQGKADSAAGMLHNVRNALAPIRIMQEKWLAEEGLPYRRNLARAMEELASDTLDPARRADLEQFMISAARKIALTSEGRIGEMEETKSSIDQIAEILGSYDFDTSGSRAAEAVDLFQTLRSEGKTLAAREGGPVTFILPETLPKVQANRVHLAQVLGNILVNAHEAMIAAEVPNMTISVTQVSKPDGTVDIRITDNGDGIEPENIAKAFHRGYSTRHHKAGGLGMHWSANAMRAMGGSIALESEGKGKGATAVLTLKRAQAEDLKKAA